MPMSISGHGRFRFHIGRHQLKRPIHFRPITGCPVMPGDEIDRCGPRPSAALAAQPRQQIFKGHVAFAFHQQPHRLADRPAAAMQLDHAPRPVR
jgi:hypothetical protein